MKVVKFVSAALCSSTLFTSSVFANTTIGTWSIENQSSLKLFPNSNYIQAPSGCVEVTKAVIDSNTTKTLSVSTPDSSTKCPSNYDFSIFYLYSNKDGSSTSCQFYATMKKDEASGKYDIYPNSNLGSTCLGFTNKIKITAGGEKNSLVYTVNDITE